MAHTVNLYGQTREWEDACIQTRRNIKKRKKRLSVFSIQKKDSVLDLGCGDGLNIQILHEMGIKHVVGVDISKPLLKIAQKNNPQTQFFYGSAEKLPFKDKMFDVIFVDSVFHHLLTYKKATQEMHRVLKKNGLLCFIEPHKNLLRSLLDSVSTLSVSKYIPFLKERSQAYLGERKFMTHWIATEDEFYQTLEKNGFKKLFHQHQLLSLLGQYKKI